MPGFLFGGGLFGGEKKRVESTVAEQPTPPSPEELGIRDLLIKLLTGPDLATSLFAKSQVPGRIARMDQPTRLDPRIADILRSVGGFLPAMPGFTAALTANILAPAEIDRSAGPTITDPFTGLESSLGPGPLDVRLGGPKTEEDFEEVINRFSSRPNILRGNLQDFVVEPQETALTRRAGEIEGSFQDLIGQALEGTAFRRGGEGGEDGGEGGGLGGGGGLGFGPDVRANLPGLEGVLVDTATGRVIVDPFGRFPPGTIVDPKTGNIIGGGPIPRELRTLPQFFDSPSGR